MRIVVTGAKGQLVHCLAKTAPCGVELFPVGRPALDLENISTIQSALEAYKPEVIISAAAFTNVDLAETEPRAALVINSDGAGAVAQAAQQLNVPLIHISTDYVFAGDKGAPYNELDVANPICVYGVSKLAGEAQVQAATHNHVILRVGWLYSPFARNFLRTVLKLSTTQDTLRIVSDQRGGPTSAFMLSSVIFTIAKRIVDDNSSQLRGIFHVAPTGDATWAEFAEVIVGIQQTITGKKVQVEAITSGKYPTLAKRPLDSRLSTEKIQTSYNISFPHWRTAAPTVVASGLRQMAREATS